MLSLWVWGYVCLHTTVWHTHNLEHTTIKILGAFCVFPVRRRCVLLNCIVPTCGCVNLYEVMSVCQGLSSRTSVLGSSNNNFQELCLVFSNCTLVTLAYSSLEKTSYSLAAFGHES